MSQRKLIKDTNVEFSEINTVRSNVKEVEVKAPRVQVSTGEGAIQINKASTV